MFALERKDVETALLRTKQALGGQPWQIPGVKKIREIVLNTPIPFTEILDQQAVKPQPQVQKQPLKVDHLSELRQMQNEGPKRGESRKNQTAPPSFNNYQMYGINPYDQSGSSSEEEEED